MNHATTGSLWKKLIVLAVIVVGVWLTLRIFPSTDDAPVNTANPQQTTKSASTAFDRHSHSTTDPASIWVIVNKQHPLNPKTFVPDLVVPSVQLKTSAKASNMHVSTSMAPDLERLFQAAASAGHPLMLSSGYRSYQYQVSVHDHIVNTKGENAADQESARPGYSEHQTGLAADVAPISGRCDLATCFGTTPEGKWLADQAYAYGFIIRYPAGKEARTGYEYEPWHIRYVGVPLATEMHREHVQTLEEFFQVAGGRTYK